MPEEVFTISMIAENIQVLTKENAKVNPDQDKGEDSKVKTQVESRKVTPIEDPFPATK